MRPAGRMRGPHKCHALLHPVRRGMRTQSKANDRAHFQRAPGAVAARPRTLGAALQHVPGATSNSTTKLTDIGMGGGASAVAAAACAAAAAGGQSRAPHSLDDAVNVIGLLAAGAAGACSTQRSRSRPGTVPRAASPLQPALPTAADLQLPRLGRPRCSRVACPPSMYSSALSTALQHKAQDCWSPEACAMVAGSLG